MKDKKPLVSIVMPVYNAGNFLLEAIKSLQNQTFQNWELIMVDDCSTDNSWAILKNLAKEDKRIRIYQVKTHGGVACAANLALAKAKGDLIARMDADDISLPWRIEKQVKFLQNHPKAIALGGQCELINQAGEIIGKKQFPLENSQIKKMIFWSIPLQQPTLMVNRKLLPKDFKWYEKEFNVAEEVELLFKLFQYGEVFNLPETVLFYRIHGKNTSLQNPKRTFLLTFKTRMKAISKYGYQPTISGFLLNLIQFSLIILLPSQWIFPIYSFIRGMKRISLAVLPKPLLLQKRAQIS